MQDVVLQYAHLLLELQSQIVDLILYLLIHVHFLVQIENVIILEQLAVQVEFRCQ